MTIVTIFSNKENIIIKIKERSTHEEVMKELKSKLIELKQFYQEEKTPILVTGKTLKSAEIDDIESMIQQFLNVKVNFDSPRDMGLAGIKKNFRKEIASSDTKYITGSLRSGQQVEYEGSVVVIGDVNYGAQIIAEDNIVVLGKLRGMCHAGAKGNEQAVIAARIIEANQIRIASTIKERTKEEIQEEAYSIAFVNDNGQIELSN